MPLPSVRVLAGRGPRSYVPRRASWVPLLVAAVILLGCAMAAFSVHRASRPPAKSPFQGLGKRPSQEATPQEVSSAVPRSSPENSSAERPLCSSASPLFSCMGPLEREEMKHFTVYFTGCKAGEPERAYPRSLLDPNYRTALPHIAFRFEPLTNAGHGIFGAVIVSLDHRTCARAAVKLLQGEQNGRDAAHSAGHELRVMTFLS
eukprot:RCo054247